MKSDYPFANALLISIGFSCRTRDFRHLGIGRLMMRRLLAEARAAGLREVWGSVTRDDIDRAPHLLDWYRRLGFMVLEADQECIPTAAKKIVMRLDADRHSPAHGTAGIAVVTTAIPAMARPRLEPGAAVARGGEAGCPVAMSGHTLTLRQLARELLSVEQSARLDQVIGDGAIDFRGLVELDESLGWASMGNVSAGGTGNYAPSDRAVFRPLQYCASYFGMMGKGSDAEWLTRETVHMASLHLESLASRISLTNSLPLGRAVRAGIFRQQVDPATWDVLDRFRHVFNAAKHDMRHPKDTHLFSKEDAVLAYFVCRALGRRLRHLAKLDTCFGEEEPR